MLRALRLQNSTIWHINNGFNSFVLFSIFVPERKQDAGWAAIIEAYTKTSLKKPHDKLPDLTGLAEHFAGNNTAYIAGFMEAMFAGTAGTTLPRPSLLGLRRPIEHKHGVGRHATMR
jgi:hypothetical protein